MAGFTDEEVATAVDRFLLKQLEVPVLKTGARDVITLRDRVYDLLTTALLLRPDAYFYVVYLARNRLLGLVAQQIAALNSISEAGPNTTRPVKKIKSTTDLSSAQASLLELSAGLTQRSTGVRGSIGPAVDRFRRSISSFVDTELTKNILVNNAVTETGPELRKGISTIWSEAVSRHEEIIELAASISSALSSLERVRLPESSIRDIVSRIQDRLGEVKATLETDRAAEESRLAMLDLLTMRSLLSKASAFRNPEEVLMPKPRDGTTALFLDSTGSQASVAGTVSGPFNYDPGAVLSLSVNGGTPVSVPLPRSKGSRAELRSRAFSPWVLPTSGDQVAFLANSSTTVFFSLLSAYASGPLAAAAINAGLSPVVDVSWDAGTSQLVFRTAEEGDTASLVLLTDTVARVDFRAWAFPVTSVPFIENRAEPVPAQEVVAAIGTASPLVEARRVFTSYADFIGTRDETLPSRILNIVDQGSDLVSTNTTTLSSPSKNFQVLGVKPGMGLSTTLPTVAQYTVLGVSAQTLVLDSAPPAGSLTYRIGPDYREIPAQARVRVTGASRSNTGYYRVVSSGIAQITVDRNLTAADAALSTSVFTDLIEIDSVGTTTSTGIGALVSSAGATALGIAITASERKPLLTRLQLAGAGDLLLRGVRSGDLITLTSPSLALYSTEIDQILSPTSFTIQQTSIAYEPGAWTFEIRSVRAANFLALQSAIGDFLTSSPVSNFEDLDESIGRVIRGARFNEQAEDRIDNYVDELSDLQSSLTSYVVPQERTIDNSIKTMREQGFDRALDLLLTLQVEELFSMEPDGVSYSSWLLRKSATVAREVVPVSKFAKGQRVLQEWRTISYQVDPWAPGPRERNEP